MGDIDLEFIDAPMLLQAAATETGLDDYGDPSFVEPLGEFVDSVMSESRLNQMGLVSFKLDVIRLLSNRLRYVDDLKRAPDIRSEDVSDPIVIVGIPRTGTTKLQCMLGRDEGLQKLQMWRALNPAPLPGVLAGEPDPRIAVAEGFVRMLAEQFLDFLAAHPMHAQEPEEDVLLLQMTFESPVNSYYYRVPSYFSWLRGRSAVGPYQYLAEILRYLQWQDGGRRGRPWVLKSPVHLGHLQALFTAFPDATVVHCHRDPSVAVPSLCRLVEALRPSRGIDYTEPAELGDFFLAICVEAWKANLEYRTRSHHADALLDVSYSRIAREPIAVIEELYEHRGYSVDPETHAAMVRWEKENPPGRFGRHEYSLERYGLTTERVDESFADYLAYFADVLRE